MSTLARGRLRHFAPIVSIHSDSQKSVYCCIKASSFELRRKVFRMGMGMKETLTSHLGLRLYREGKSFLKVSDL